MQHLVNLKPADRHLLEFLQRTGRRLNCRLYLVGGTVRDILLGYENWDLDIVGVGNTSLVAKAIQKKFPVKIIAYPRFGTFVVNQGPDADRQHWFDLATARGERYKYPGALPEVFPVKRIEDDLGRRDFTINALALSLDVLARQGWRVFSDEDVIDCFAGRSDLAKRILRIIKPDSFSEDPTRIFRASRFVYRFGLKLSSATSKALNQSRKNLPLISPARRYQEIKYILLEKNPARVFQILRRWHLLEYLVAEKPHLLKLFLNYPDADFSGADYGQRLKIFWRIDKKMSEEFSRFFEIPRALRVIGRAPD